MKSLLWCQVQHQCLGFKETFAGPTAPSQVTLQTSGSGSEAALVCHHMDNLVGAGGGAAMVCLSWASTHCTLRHLSNVPQVYKDPGSWHSLTLQAGLWAQLDRGW